MWKNTSSNKNIKLKTDFSFNDCIPKEKNESESNSYRLSLLYTLLFGPACLS